MMKAFAAAIALAAALGAWESAAQSNVDASAALAKKINANPKAFQKLLFPKGKPDLIVGVSATKVSGMTMASGPIMYQWKTVPSASPVAALEANFINCNSAPQTISYTFTESRTNEVSHEFSYGFSQEVRVSVSGGAGPFGQVTGEVAFQANQQITNASMNSKTVQWEIPITVNADPNTYQKGQMMVSTIEAEGTFSMPVYASGDANVTLEVKTASFGKPVVSKESVKMSLDKLIPNKEDRRFVLTGKVTGVNYGTGTAIVGPAYPMTDPALRRGWCPSDGLGPAPATMRTAAAPAGMRTAAATQGARVEPAQKGSSLKPISNGRVLATAEPKVSAKK